MSSYPPPLSFVPIFNASKYDFDPLTQVSANKLYIKKTGADVAVGPLTLNNQILLASGIATSPSLTFSSDTDTGLYLSTANTLSITTAGFQRFSISTTKTTTNLNLVVPSGTSSNCGIQSSTSANSGFVLGSSQVNIVSGGTTVASYSPTVLTNTCNIRNQNGSATSPSYSFASETGMGLHYVGTNKMGLGVAGLKVLELSPTGLTFTSSGVSGASPTILNYFEAYTYTTTFGFVGFNQTINYSIRINRIGNMCYLYVPSWSAAVTNNSGGNALCITATAMASRFYPPNGISAIGYGYLNGTANLVWLYINSVGNILIYKGVGAGNATWANGESCKIEGFSACWTVD